MLADQKRIGDRCPGVAAVGREEQAAQRATTFLENIVSGVIDINKSGHGYVFSTTLTNFSGKVTPDADSS